MEALPPELKIEVMQRVDEISSLSTLIHSIPSFFNVFIKAKRTILRSVLRRAIQPYVMRDALIVVDSSKLKAPIPVEVRQFLIDYKHMLKTKIPTVSTEPWSPLSLHMDLARKHKLVEWFTYDLCSMILSKHPFTHQQDETKPSTVSTEETVRIHRALYRFELYCDLFRRSIPSRLGSDEAREQLLDLWPAWEVEELSCIHTYLSRRLSDVIDEVAEHDVELADFYGNVAFDRFHLNEMKEYALSLGLCFLHNLLTEPNYEKRRLILARHRDADMDFLGRTLETGFFDPDDLSGDVAQVGSITETDSNLTPSSGQDPNEAWLWAYRSEGYLRDYCAWNKLDLREWCYCIWDKRRLSSLKVLATPWSEDRFTKWKEAVKQECDCRFKKIVDSLDERCDVLMLGGSGYWTEDWSKLVWPPGREPGPRRSVPPEYQYIVDWQPRKP